jgi:hypothetical protein
LVKVACRADVPAIFLGSLSSFTADDKDGNGLRLALKAQGSAKIEPRKIGHAQVHQDGVRLVEKSQGQGLLEVVGIHNFEILRQIDARQAANRGVIINNS